MEAFSSYFSFAVSVCSALFTFYFWIVKARQERPSLKCYAVDPQLSGYAFSSSGDPIKLIFEPKLILANYSSLPNAVLGATVWMRHRDDGWLPTRAVIDAATPLPLNLAPMQTTRLGLRLTIEVPPVAEGDRCRNTHETFALYRNLMLPERLELRVELTSLGGCVFTSSLRYQPRDSGETTTAGLRLVA
jgi:hypothetical protein